jgi:hypothetical protein
MALHLIAEDLEDHLWYDRLVVETVADVEAFAGRWAAFEEFVAAYGDRTADHDESSR